VVAVVVVVCVYLYVYSCVHVCGELFPPSINMQLSAITRCREEKPEDKKCSQYVCFEDKRKLAGFKLHAVCPYEKEIIGGGLGNFPGHFQEMFNIFLGSSARACLIGNVVG